MHHLLSILLLCVTTAATAGESRVVTSPANRVAMLELYTSEGCSSCPPADRWLSRLRDSGITSDRIIPLAFHVTYWDYIGWEDSFGKEQYDERQRVLGRANRLSTIYTPQFVLSGKDFRSYRRFTSKVRQINDQPAEVDLALSLAKADDGSYTADLRAENIRTAVKDVALYIALQENELSTHVEDGENEGETLHHDFVVRSLSAPAYVSRPQVSGETRQVFHPVPGWKVEDMHVVGFAQDPHTGEILQAVRMALEE